MIVKGAEFEWNSSMTTCGRSMSFLSLSFEVGVTEVEELQILYEGQEMTDSV